MCTLTVIPLDGGGIRVRMNRDELRSRARALPPVVRAGIAAGVDAAWPTDPESGGTWVAATSNGLVLALLNVNEAGAHGGAAAPRSRGLIIPPLARCASPAEAIDRAEARNLAEFRPFRLIAADLTTIAELRWDGRSSRTRASHLAPAIFTSSGLGDHLVEAPRRDLWEMWIEAHGQSPAAQDSFHEHSWDDRRHLSVMMDRADARTVSVTTIVLRADGDVEMTYADDDTLAEVHMRGASVSCCHSGPAGG